MVDQQKEPHAVAGVDEFGCEDTLLLRVATPTGK